MSIEVKVLELPPFISRTEIEKFFPGVLTRATLAKLASEGRGPRYMRLNGRRVVYRTHDLLEWLKKQGVEVHTHE